jgi:hypothetical protein
VFVPPETFILGFISSRVWDFVPVEFVMFCVNFRRDDGNCAPPTALL